MRNIKKYAIILALGGLITFSVFLKIENTKIKKENIEILQKEKKKIKKIRDSVLVENKKIISLHLKQLDSIIEIKQKIKYIKYEKYHYIDRTLDDALHTLSNYSYKRTKEKN